MIRSFLTAFLAFYAWVFLVTWNEYQLKGHHAHNIACMYVSDGSCVSHDDDYYTIEITTRSIRLQTMSDVNTFIPHNVGAYRLPGMIPGAFNVKWKEEQP